MAAKSRAQRIVNVTKQELGVHRYVVALETILIKVYRSYVTYVIYANDILISF